MPLFAPREIVVLRWRVPRCDIYQTVYFPDWLTGCYRASITGDLFIAEFIGNSRSQTNIYSNDEVDIFAPFGLKESDCKPLFEHANRQTMGKITPIDDVWRRQFIQMLSSVHGIYSLGRYATWRNILLDDVLKDIRVIKSLIGSDTYMHARHRAGD